MENLNAVEILIVEDNQQDAELTLLALRKQNLANQTHVVAYRPILASGE